jgi:hypothetical protein
MAIGRKGNCKVANFLRHQWIFWMFSHQLQAKLPAIGIQDFPGATQTILLISPPHLNTLVAPQIERKLEIQFLQICRLQIVTRRRTSGTTLPSPDHLPGHLGMTANHAQQSNPKESLEP